MIHSTASKLNVSKTTVVYVEAHVPGPYLEATQFTFALSNGAIRVVDNQVARSCTN